jgi:transposase InsO family protein/PHD/YefM family antitoxin component YafN of YafNO toxin-antitoxin module
VNERLRFIAARQEGLYTMAELCERTGISRKTGYEWDRRYAELGVDGLKPRSHAPHGCPHRIESGLAELLLDARRMHPHWGPRKLLPWLAGRHPELEGRLPAASTVGDLLKRHNLVPAVRRRRPRVHKAGKPPAPEALNGVWAADYKGDFRTRDGKRCYPLTITDLYSRALLTCQALLSVSFEESLPHWENCFRKNGLPERIRTDNGAPFATSSALGLTRLNIFWTRLGIVHDRIERGRPDQNGSHERMHRTLKKEATLPPGDDQAGQQRRFDEWREEFVHERPHEALGQKTPGSVYARSPRHSKADMTTVSYSTARERLAEIWDDIEARGEGVILRRRGHEDLALLPAHELRSLRETVHLLRSPRNATRLLRALASSRGDAEETFDTDTALRSSNLKTDPALKNNRPRGDPRGPIAVHPIANPISR